MSVRLALWANPASGGSTDEGEVEDALRDRGAELVDEQDAERLVVAGGDGSVAPAAERAQELGVPLAVVPTGTANDFARAAGLPDDLEAACELAATGSTIRTLDLGRKDGRPFVTACSAGLAVDAARSASGLKKALGPLAYAVGALHAGA
ncbi:MAG TPA: diacylglycerol kinase family protein, partial [Thermoleophilaceae bacterium]|nr:diacylglycerol kinase family protein [Thermoleophilaceae bacterium]